MIRFVLTGILLLSGLDDAHAQNSPKWQSRTSNTACVGLGAATKPGCQRILASQFKFAFAGKLDVSNPTYLATQSKVAALGTNQTPSQPVVFVGAVYAPDNLSNAQAVSSLTASGKIGIYWHFSGLFSQIQDGTDQAAVAIWNPLGAGVGEMPYSTCVPESDTVITVANSGKSPVNVSAGALVSDSGSGQWTVVLPNLLVALDNRPQLCTDPVQGRYVIPASGSCLVDVQSTTVGPTTIAANAITAFAPTIAGLSITASDAVIPSSARPTSGVNYGRVGYTPDNSFWTRTDGGGFTSLLTGRSHPVTEADINIDYQTSHTAADVAAWKSYVDAARLDGVQNVAPVVQPDQSYANPSGGGNFTNAFNTTYRQMALYGGGIAFDEPPRHALSFGYGYIQWMESAILWARANNLRSSWIISPDSYAQGTFVEDLHSLVSILRHDGALPTQWIVENYRTQCGATTIGNDATQTAQTTAVSTTCPSGAPAVPYGESLNFAALFLANTVSTAPAAAIKTNQGLPEKASPEKDRSKSNKVPI